VCPTFLGKGSHPLLWATLQVARGKIAVSGIPNSLNYYVIVIAYAQLTNLVEGCIIDGGCRGLDTHCLHPHGLVFIYAQGKRYFQDYLLKFFCLVGLIYKNKCRSKKIIKIFIMCILYLF
jgi:hypothetical protein